MLLNQSETHDPEDLALSLALELERRRDIGRDRWTMFAPLATLLCDCGSIEDKTLRRKQYAVYVDTLKVFIRQLDYERASQMRIEKTWGNFLKSWGDFFEARYAILLLRYVAIRHALRGRDERGHVGQALTRLKAALA